MVMIAVLSVIMVGCKANYHAVKEKKVEVADNTLITANTRYNNVEELQKMISEKKDWHIIVYDTRRESEAETGKPPIAAEAWMESVKEIKEDKTITENTEEQRKEENEYRLQEEQDTETEAGIRVGLEWWQTMAMAGGAMMILLLMMAIRRAAKNR